MIPWTHHPNWQLDQFSRFSTIHICYQWSEQDMYRPTEQTQKSTGTNMPLMLCVTWPNFNKIAQSNFGTGHIPPLVQDPSQSLRITVQPYLPGGANLQLDQFTSFCRDDATLSVYCTLLVPSHFPQKFIPFRLEGSVPQLIHHYHSWGAANQPTRTASESPTGRQTDRPTERTRS